MQKKVLITGIRGQDGSYLAKLLLEKGYQVFGADRRSGESSVWRLKELGIEKEVKIIYMDLLELTNILKVIERIMPDEVYNLAAQSFVQVSFEQPIITTDIDALGVLRILESLRITNPKAKFYQASTSEMFGYVNEIPQNENTPFHPRSPYGAAKLYGHWITINYRESYNLFACSGILFNHESPLRGEEFVTRKITTGIAKIKYGQQEKLVLGNLNSKRDWGYAGDYVKGIWQILQQEKPDDYVLATGENYSVKEFIEEAFKVVGFDLIWEGKDVNEKARDKKTKKVLVEVSSEFYRPAEIDFLLGDYRKAKTKFGWQPQTSFKELVRLMVEKDLQRIKDNRL